jgi:DNA repair protein RecN (Recombination protein N)
MLTDLVVENLGVIEAASLTLEPGCSALTGETGAGKTLVVTALSLLAGSRAEPAWVRPPANQARVEGRFLLSPRDPALEVLDRNGILEGASASGVRDTDPIEIVVSRTISASGSKARINGRLVTAALLAEFGRTLLDVVGQHDHQRLFAPSFARTCLDSFSGDPAVALATDVAEAVRTAARHKRALAELEVGEQERARALDVLHYEISEIQAAQIQVGERERLLGEAAMLESSEAVAAAVSEAIEALSSEGGAEERLVLAQSALRGIAGLDPAVGSLYERASSALHEVADIALELRARSTDPDPDTLERIHDRLAVINQLIRKYGRNEIEVLRYLDTSQDRAAELAGMPELQSALQEQLNAARRQAEATAARLSKLRRRTVPILQQAVQAVLAELALPTAKIEFRLEGCGLYEGGAETVELFIDLNGRDDLRPLKQVASGGELSRIALALHLVATSSSAATMVFDEVDAGVGGEAARALGRCLARLARSSGGQVFVITHLPQVAAYADNHYSVSKGPQAGHLAAQVVRIDGDVRVSELSRMLAGLPQSDRAHEHARELLELALEAS